MFISIYLYTHSMFVHNDMKGVLRFFPLFLPSSSFLCVSGFHTVVLHITHVNVFFTAPSSRLYPHSYAHCLSEVFIAHVNL